MLTREEEITINNYDQMAHQWSLDHQETAVFDNAFPSFQAYLPAGKVLEIGCGGGRDGIKIVRACYDYTGVDRSFGLLQEAKQSFPNLKLAQQDIYQLGFQEKFDGFWCTATLIHLPKSRIGEALESFHGVTKPGGVGFICIKEGEGDMVLDKEEYEGQIFERYFTYYRSDEFALALSDNQFELLEAYRLPVSPKTTWLNYFVTVA